MAREAAQKIGFTEEAVKGAHVFIKPNLIAAGLHSFNAASGEVTKPEIILGIAEQCLAAGAARVTIGDGGQLMLWDWQELTCLEDPQASGARDLASGMQQLAEKYASQQIELTCLNLADEWLPIPSSSHDPLMKKGLLIAKSFYEADHVISVPVIASNAVSGLMGSLMNYIGVTPLAVLGQGSMVRFLLQQAYAQTKMAGVEAMGAAGAALDIHGWRQSQGRRDFAIVDGSIGLEGNGPLVSAAGGGHTLDMRQRCRLGEYYLLASDDAVAADSLMAQIMGFGPGEVKHLVAAQQVGLGQSRNICLQGAALEALKVRNFKRPQAEAAPMAAAW
jgi:uncharacterized protein (DUF362 family)